MPRTTEDILATLPKARQDKIRARAKERIDEVEGLQAVRKLAGFSQAQLAQQLGKKQPSIHKMESQADFYVSTLERFVQAAGGTVDIVINLPGHPPVKLKRFADIDHAA